MIIEKVIIHTFGGLSGIEMDLEEGMNVIVGPNESGKSTIYNAIENTLFTHSNLTPSKLKKQMGRYMPVSGGDTIEVTIHLKSNRDRYALQRRWGATVASSLKLPDGSLLTDDGAIQDKIGECLQVPEGTCKTIMLTYQSGLAKTVHDIQESRETLRSLGDLLRKAIMEMDGVSIDMFKARIADLYNNYFGRWNIDADYPEGNRGIENKWKAGVGSITNQFYAKEEVRKVLYEAVSFETELDELNEKISEHAEEFQESESFVRKYKPFKDDAIKRQQIEADLKGLNLEYEKLEAINKDWPVIESKIKEKEKRLPELANKKKELEQEKEKAEAYREGKEILDRFSRVEKRKQAVDEAEKGLKNLAVLTDENLQELREVIHKTDSLETSLSAGRLSARFSPKKNMELDIQKDLSDREQTRVKAGEKLEFQADGRLLLSNPEWEMEVTSGEVKYDQVLKEYEKGKSAVDVLLKKFKVKSLEDAEAANRAYKAELSKLENARSNLEYELDGLTYDELKNKADGVTVKKPGRELETILGELADKGAETKSLEGELEELKEKLQNYVEEYGDHKKLFEKVAEVAGKTSEKNEALGKLKPLPEEFDDVKIFIREYEDTESRLSVLRDDHSKLIQERIRLEARAPDRSVEEIKKNLAEAEEKFEAEKRRGLAIARIKKTMEDLLKEMDRRTYEGLEKEVAEFVQKMTAGRYENVTMDGSTPRGFQRKDGIEMPYDYLSAGTRDVLGMALRLAITKKFLEEKEGFVVMDDPLVDLDPNRQSLAANAINNFAEDKQIIIFTCHPSHSKLLGGNRILLD